VYVGDSLWQSFDGYAASAGERTVSLKLSEEGPLSFEIRVRKEKNLASSGYTVRFKQLVVSDVAYDLHTITYQYDLLSRLLSADYVPGSNLTATPFRAYDYTYDRAGNRLSQSLSLNGAAPTVTNYTYNAANQVTNAGFTYDNNGNLTSDGTNTYTWDRANRLLSMDTSSYAYDGVGNRVQQTVGVNVTQYLLDLQPGLSVVLTETQGANTTRYVHGPTGIHAHKDSANNWEWMVQDGLGSVHGVVDNTVAVLESRLYDPYGVPFGATGTNQTSYGFTGEPTDGNGLVHLRARYYAPNLGVFTSLDPLETANRYAYVDGNPINRIDSTGLQPPCQQNQLGCVSGEFPRVIVTQNGTRITITPIEPGYTSASLGAGQQIYVEAWRPAPFYVNTIIDPVAMGQVTNIVTIEAYTGAAPIILNVAFNANAISVAEIAEQFRANILAVYNNDGTVLWTEGSGQPLPGVPYYDDPNVTSSATYGGLQPQPDPGDVQVDPNPNDPCRQERNLVQIWRGVGGNKKPNQNRWKNPSLKERDFRRDPDKDSDGLSFFEFEFLPVNGVTPYAYPFTVRFEGQKLPGVTGPLVEEPTCKGKFTPNIAPGHWSVDCGWVEDKLLSAYASSNRNKTILYPRFNGDFPDHRDFDW
jgi:RHS repeat-associated protein